MSDLYTLGKQLNEFLRGLLQLGESSIGEGDIGRFARVLKATEGLGGTESFGGLSLEALVEARARAKRRDAARVPGSHHFATMLAYGDFILADGGTIRCEGIPGISGVATSREVRTAENDSPSVHLDRVITHFHFNMPSVLIEQNNSRSSIGTLTGVSKGDMSALLPGKASFSQYLILTLEGRSLANREPLVMTADRVEEWPPVGATFVSEAPTDFFDLAQLDNPDARVVATLAACKSNVIQDLTVPELLPPSI